MYTIYLVALGFLEMLLTKLLQFTTYKRTHGNYQSKIKWRKLDTEIIKQLNATQYQTPSVFLDQMHDIYAQYESHNNFCFNENVISNGIKNEQQPQRTICQKVVRITATAFD